MANQVTWVIEGSIDPSNKSAYIALMNDMLVGVSKEAGTLMYEWYIGDDDSSITVYERYRDSDSALLHLSESWAPFQDRYLGLVNINKFSVYSPVSETLGNAIAGLNPIYIKQLGGFVRL